MQLAVNLGMVVLDQIEDQINLLPTDLGSTRDNYLRYMMYLGTVRIKPPVIIHCSFSDTHAYVDCCYLLENLFEVSSQVAHCH